MITYTYIRTISILAAAGTLLAGHASAQMQASPDQAMQAPQQQGQAPGGNIEQQLQEVQIKLQETQAQLQPAIQQANEQPEVRDALLGFDQALTAQMIEAEPDQSEAIERRSELFGKLINNRDFGSMDADAQQAYQAHVQEYQGLQQVLLDSERQAMSAPEVRAKLQDYQQAQQDALVEVEPRAAELLQRQQQLRQQFQTLQRQLQESAGQ